MNYPTRIGIVGGGQLARMMTLAAKKLGFSVIVSDPTPQSPAGQVADKQILGDYKDETAIKKLTEESDVITVDAEFVNTEALEKLEKSGKQIHPSSQTISLIKDKLIQKEFLKKNNIPTADFTSIEKEEDIINSSKLFGFPLLLKARTDAYDGKGNFVIKTEKDIAEGLKKLAGRKLYIEKYVGFKKELAIMIARNTHGEVVTYPVVETIHKDNICDIVIAPANISKKADQNAQKLAHNVLKHLKGAGVFGIEMFLKKDDNVLVNEIAPRVHNSGHLTIEGCVTSQFEQHIRAITGLPLGSTALISKAVVMKNIIGTKEGPGFPKGLEIALRIPEVSIHLYGKKETRIGRKMGHITVAGNNVTECLKKAEQARKALII